eukprot:COSAG01_NODE_2858_length_6960_cov_31.694797_3_plen_427_part_00
MMKTIMTALVALLPPKICTGSAASAARAAGACSTALDCALNGDCVAGRCQCYPPWTGDAACHTFAFLPTRTIAAYPPNRPMSASGHNTTSWGGSIVHDAGTQLYHMFAAEMENDCKLNSFLTNSACIHATSKSPTGPFEKQDVVVGPYCHNPAITVRQFANGSSLWVLFHVADVGTDRGPPKDCASESAPELPLEPLGSTRATNSDTSTQHWSSGPDGPWHPIAIAGPMANCNNPAPFVHKNGSWYVVCRPNYGLWRSDNILGGEWSLVANITTQMGGNWRTWKVEGQLDGHYEDPVMWVDGNGGWHVISHVYRMDSDAKICTPGHNGSVVSGHYFSEDGHNWHASAVAPFGNTVTLTDNSTQLFSTLERPKLLFDDEGNPTHLSNGACTIPSCGGPCANCKYNCIDFTRVSPLDMAPPSHVGRGP